MSDWLEALRVASESPAIDLVTAGALDEIRHLLVVGRLFDREDLDYDQMRDFGDALGHPMSKEFLRDLVAKGIGGSDEK